MIAIDYDNRLASSYFRLILERYKPDLVQFFHLNRLGTGLIEHAVQAGIPRFMIPTDFWTVCPTGQLMYSDGSLCTGPSVHAGNCVKHMAQSSKGRIIRIIANKVPIFAADLLVQLTQKGFMPSYPQREEVMAIAPRLDINISRLNQLTRLVVPNRFMSDLLIRHGVSPPLLVESAFGIDPTSNAGIERPSVSNSPLRLGFIGTHAPHKGCHVLLKAFNALPDGQAVLRIYGDMGQLPEYSSELRRLAGNNDAIIFCGTFQNSRIGEIFADLDVLVVPSLWYENTPLVVYSAQAARCPVVASDLPGLSSIIRHSENGLLFSAGDTESLTSQLSRLIDDPQLSSLLSRNSQQPKSTASYVDELLAIWTST